MIKNKNKTINNVNKLKTEVNIVLNKEELSNLENYFKRRFIVIENNKITYPLKEEIKKKIKNLKTELSKNNKLKRYWINEKENAKNYYKRILYTKYFNKDYWKHKIKEITNKEYKNDFKDINISEEILMDPEYKHLLNAFLIDPDYRKKLKDTVNTSIIYKKTNIGNISKKKQEFKINTSTHKIKQLKIKIIQLKKEIKINQLLIKIINLKN